MEETRSWKEYRRFASGVVFRVLGVVVSLASAIITARGLGVSGRGLFYTCTSLASISAQLLGLGMPSAIILVVAKRPALGRRAGWAALAASLGAGAVVLALIPLLTLAGGARWLPAGAVGLAPLVAGLVTGQVLLAWCSSLTVALGAVDRLPLLELIYRLASVSAAGTVLFVLRLPFWGFLATLVAVDLLSAGIWLLYASLLAPRVREMPPWPGEWVQWSGRAYLPLLLNSAMRRVDVLLLTALAGVRQSGLYSIAVQAMDLCQIAPIFLGQKAMFGFSAGRGDTPIIRQLRRLLPVLIALVMVAAGLSAEFWAPRLFGKDFSGIGPTIIALAPGAAALAWETVAAQEIAAAGFPLPLSIAWLVSFISEALLMFVFVPRYGSIATAASMSAAYGLLALLVFRIRRKIRAAKNHT